MEDTRLPYLQNTALFFFFFDIFTNHCPWCLLICLGPWGFWINLREIRFGERKKLWNPLVHLWAPGASEARLSICLIFAGFFLGPGVEQGSPWGGIGGWGRDTTPPSAAFCSAWAVRGSLSQHPSSQRDLSPNALSHPLCIIKLECVWSGTIVRYHSGEWINCHSDHSLGSVV